MGLIGNIKIDEKQFGQIMQKIDALLLHLAKYEEESEKWRQVVEKLTQIIKDKKLI